MTTAPQSISVSSAAELMDALASAQGGETVVLAAGDYSDLALRDVSFSETVTIQSADPDNMASFASVDLYGVNNLTFKNVIFDYESDVGAITYVVNVFVEHSSNISIVDSVFDGDLAEGVSDVDDGHGTGTALKVRFSDNIAVSGNEFFDWRTAISSRGVDEFRIEGNEIYNIRTDGMTFAEMDGLVIAQNHFHDFDRADGSGDHVDMIQFATGATSPYPSSNILIEGNIFNSGHADATQTIFMRNGAVDSDGAGEEMFYKNITIRDNVIYNGHNHGITVGEADGVTISNNTLLVNQGESAFGGGEPSIKVASGSLNVSVFDNVVPQFSLTPSEGWLIDNNIVVQRDDPSGANYVGDLFTNALADALATLGDLKALPGSFIEQLGLGSSLTRFDTTPAEATGYIVNSGADGFGMLTQTLDASQVFGPDGAMDLTGAEVTWDFGDGATGTGLAASHTWGGAGSYNVSATVTLPDGETVQLGKTLTVNTPLALNANFDSGAGDLSDVQVGVTVGDGVSFEGTGSDSAVRLNGGIVSYDGNQELVNNSEYTLLLDFKKDLGADSGQLLQFGGSFAVTAQADGLEVWVDSDHGGSWLRSGGLGMQDSDWHRLALTFSGDDGAAVLYLDGTEVGRLFGLDGAVQVGKSTQKLHLGSPSGSSFPGLIDNMQFWKGAMSAAQIEALSVRAEDGKFVPLEGTTTASVDDTTTVPVDDTTTVPVDDTTTDPVDDTTTVPVDEGTTEWDFADVERTLVGGNGDDNLVGGKGDDVIEGGAGNDTLRGGNGNDILMGGDDNDGLFAGHGNDILVGGRGDDLLSGKFGDDILVGGMGSDTLEGESGADLFVLNSIAESPVGEGRDKIVDFSQGEDKIDLSRLAVAGKADGAFTLIGTAAFSNVAGELRQFDDANGIVVEGDVDGDGTADFQIAVHTPGLTLAPGDFVGLSATALAASQPALMEDITTLDGTEEVTHLGTPVNDHLIGTDGADVMDGRANDDTLRGKAGNDSLYGGDGDDKLYAGQGDDLLVGGAGNDLLNGGNGDDVLIGGFGQDSLTGGSGADTFVFETAFDSLPGADNRDTVEDFSRQEGDKLDLSAIDADANTTASDSFVFIEQAGFSGSAGELRYFVNGQGHAVVDGDTDGDAESDFQFVVADTSLLTLDDFTL